MATDSIRLVQALVSAGSQERTPKGTQIPHGPVVTVSRYYGSGGKEVAERLAKRIGVRCFDREILEAVVESARVDRYLMEELDEAVRGSMSDWIYTLLTGKSVFSEDYRRHLFNVILAISKQGGVIVGRGGNLILSGRKDVFRLRLVGSQEKCAERVAERKTISKEDARKEIIETEKEREVFIHSVFKRKTVYPQDYDLTINTDWYPTDQTVDLALHAMELRGFKIPKAH